MATLCVLVDMPVEVVTPRVFCFQTIANYYKKWQIFETFLFKIRITTYKQQGQMSETAWGSRLQLTLYSNFRMILNNMVFVTSLNKNRIKAKWFLFKNKNIL